MKSILCITVQGRVGEVEYEGKKEKVELDKKPILWSIGRVVRDISQVKGITLAMEGTTFSGVRQIVATVNTIVWVLGVKVNGKKQLKALYSAEPNITIARVAQK
ncbi:MAG: hypothetical protein Q7S48_01375 [bacterium]|nr:hypothetical protein [bacterium]